MRDAASIRSEILDRRNTSRDWFNENFYGEWAEVYRNLKCRVKPFIKKDADGNEVEDKGRTNVCLPDHYVMVSRGTARLTVNPPNLRVRGGKDMPEYGMNAQQQRDRVTALMYYQWDRSEQQRVFKEVVHQAKAFGWSVEKEYWDEVKVTRRVRRATERAKLSDVLRANGRSEEEIAEILAQRGGQDAMSPEEVAMAVAEFGDELTLDVPTTKYEGPVGERMFIGDIFVEPGFRSIHKSAFVIEDSGWDLARMKYWLNVTVRDPDGQEHTVFDRHAVDRLIEKTPSANDPKANDLRSQMREAVMQGEPKLDGRLRGRRWRMLEQHSVDDDGMFRIDWLGEESELLGYMYYPWDTYGKYCYNELVLHPDVLGGVGDSSPRITRFLLQLRNTTKNQITDFKNKKLRPVITTIRGADIPNEAFERGNWREVQLDRHDDMRVFHDPNFPVEAFNDDATNIRDMQQVEPVTTDFAPGNETVPQAGKFATGLVMQGKSTDNQTRDELNQIGFFLRDVLELRLAMTQQQQTKKLEIEAGMSERIDALALVQGEARSIQIDALELQEDFEIIPEVDSVLAADDAYKTAAKERGFAIAAEHPDVFNKRAFAKKLAETIPGMSIEEALAPEQAPAGPDVKITFSVSAKWPELAGDLKVAILGGAGLPTEGTAAQATMEEVGKLAEAGDAAARLNEPADPAAGGAPGAHGNARAAGRVERATPRV